MLFQPLAQPLEWLRTCRQNFHKMLAWQQQLTAFVWDLYQRESICKCEQKVAWVCKIFLGFKILLAHISFSVIANSSFKNSIIRCPTYLHGDICSLGRMALKVFISTAASTPHQWHTRGAVYVLHLCRVLLHHLHQLLNGLADASTPHFLEHQHCEWEERMWVGHKEASLHILWGILL